MDFGTLNKCFNPTQMQHKDLPPPSPSSRKLPSLSKTTDMPSKGPLSVQRSSPKAVGAFHETKSPKTGPLRLIPLSIEPRSKEHVTDKLKLTPTQKKGTSSQKTFEGPPVAVFFDKRPISEQFSQEIISNKLSKKISFKAYGDWLEKNTKKPVAFKPTMKTQASVEAGGSSPQSKFKAKILTARAKEDNITNELKTTNISRKDSSKEYPSIDISDSGSLKRSEKYVTAGLNLLTNLEVSKFHALKSSQSSNKTFDSSSVGKKSDKDTSRVESILLQSTASYRKSQIMQNNTDNQDLEVKSQTQHKRNSLQMEGSEGSENPPTTQPTTQHTEEADAQPQQPRKLFQRNNGVPMGRPPMLFMQQKPGVSFGNRVPSPNVPIVMVDRPQSKESNNKKEEEAGGKANKLPTKKENFNGEIKGNILKWKMGEFIGAGNFGQVYQGMEVESARIIAVKKIPIGNTVNRELVESLGNELNLLQKLKHKNIVQYLGHETLDNNLYIYLESMSGGNIANIIAKYGSLPEKTVKVYSKQILAGLIYLHENKVIHKDIKGANTLVDGDGTVKLADFGCSTQIEKTLSNFEGLLSNSLKGSIPWMAPEVVKETGYGRRSDVWSFGCTILEMATGKAPWSHYHFDNPVSLLMKIAVSEEIPQIPETLSKELKDFIGLCLQRDPKDRPYAQDLLGHPFLQ